MKVLKEYIRYYISGTLREKREASLINQFKNLQAQKNEPENVLRIYVRKVILEHINEVCGSVSDDVADAIATAQMAHLGQKRRSGEPYLTHPLEVADIVYTYYPDDPILCAAALLHDSLEDALMMGNVTSNQEMESLIAGSFGNPEVGNKALDIVKQLTHSKGVNYSDYVQSLSASPDVLKIKLSDMLHNLQSSPSKRQRSKYRDALDALSPSGTTPEGISSGHWKRLMSLTQDQQYEE